MIFTINFSTNNALFSCGFHYTCITILMGFWLCCLTLLHLLYRHNIFCYFLHCFFLYNAIPALAISALVLAFFGFGGRQTFLCLLIRLSQYDLLFVSDCNRFFLSNYTCFCSDYNGVLNYISVPLFVNNLQKVVIYNIL